MPSKHLKIFSTSLVIREMQIKTTVRSHFTSTRMTRFKKTHNNKCSWEHGEIGNFMHCWWDSKMVQPLWKRVWEFLKSQHTTADACHYSFDISVASATGSKWVIWTVVQAYREVAGGPDWWHIHVIPVTQEAETGVSHLEANLSNLVRPYLKIKNRRTGNVAHWWRTSEFSP